MANFFSNLGKFFFGSPEKHKRVSTLLPEQQPLFEQMMAALQNQGAGGAFGSAADYYRDLLSNDPETLRMLSAPEMRQFREQIIPGIAEQFAGMGAGNLSSGSFRNAAVNAGTDLSERLGALRAQLRAQGAAGLQNLAQGGLGNFSQDVMTERGTEGILPGALGAFGSSFLGPLGGAGANFLLNRFGGSSVGKQSNPYGGGLKRGY